MAKLFGKRIYPKNNEINIYATTAREIGPVVLKKLAIPSHHPFFNLVCGFGFL